MSTAVATTPQHPPRRALRKLTVLELKLAWREPIGLAFCLGVPIVLLLIFGLLPSFDKPVVAGSSLTRRTALQPVLITVVLLMIALISLPGPFVAQRQNQFLRRLSTTPAPRAWLLVAQGSINLMLALLGVIVIVVGDIAFFGVPAPSQAAGYILSVLLAASALFALGLVIAATARSAAAAAVIGNIMLYPLMFFAGLWTLRQTMPAVVLHISDLTPVGAAVHAMTNSMQGSFPTLGSLAVMVGWTAIATAAAIKLFRWE